MGHSTPKCILPTLCLGESDGRPADLQLHNKEALGSPALVVPAPCMEMVPHADHSDPHDASSPAGTDEPPATQVLPSGESYGWPAGAAPTSAPSGANASPLCAVASPIDQIQLHSGAPAGTEEELIG